MDENNQYCFAMTKPMPTGCVKNDPDLSWRTSNILLERVDLDDHIGHLFIVDIKFDYEKAKVTISAEVILTYRAIIGL